MATNPLSNTSYTNKDFNSIYVELLDLVKKLTYKWDPSISNESDPGVILLKLNAIIGDKNNYNIDKNILESFPETATQDVSVRSLYKQLSYRMPWYTSAITPISFTWLGKDDYALTDTSNPVIIDRFSMVTDPDSKYVYTILQDVVLDYRNKSRAVNAIEGTINTLSINGQNIVELTNLDAYNRIYFNEHNIAENGIFVYNSYGNPNEYWSQVDNIYLEDIGTKCYEFGIDTRKGLCYLEFPEDIDKLIGNGLIVKYIVSNGNEGNITSNFLDRFFQDYTADINGQSKLLDQSLIRISNSSASDNGYDPESIDDAFTNYRRTAGTFETLVTLRDYMNAIYNSELVSNAVVCDRLNDVQSSYTIVTSEEYGSGKEIVTVTTSAGQYKGFARLDTAYETMPQECPANTFYTWSGGSMTPVTQLTGNDLTKYYYLLEETEKELNAFDLRMYLLHTPGVIDSLEDYESTFELEPSKGAVQKNVIGYINEQKCIQHDFKSIIPNVPCLFKNYFQLKIKIIPYQKIEDATAKDNLISNINASLFKTINSGKLNFGEEPSYEIIYDAILSADERIKVLILDDFDYTTFATYWDANASMFKEIPISTPNTSNVIVLTGTDDSQCVNEVKSYKGRLGDKLYPKTFFVAPNYHNYVYKVVKNVPTLYSTFLDEFRKKIIAKSVLAGVTPLYIPDTQFNYRVDQEQRSFTQTDRLTTHLEVYPYGAEVDNTNNNYTPISLSKDSNKIAEYTLRENESIRFLGPSLTTNKTYANYVKFELVLAGKATTRESNLSYQDYLISSLHYKDKIIKVYDPSSDTVYIDFVPATQFTSDDTRLVNVYQYKASSGTYDLIDSESNKPFNKVSDIVKSSLNTSDDEEHNDDEPNDNSYQIRVILTPTTLKDFKGTNADGYSIDYHAKWRSGDVKVFIEEELYMIPADCDYELKAGEYITFFYKTEDSNEAPYTYEKYDEGTIIHPSFLVYGTTLRNADVPVNSLSSKGIINYDESPQSTYQKIYKMYGANDLSGTKEIAIKDLVEVTFDGSESCSYYFITNNIFESEPGKKHYVLPLTELSVGQKYRYVLDTDEYFFHVNSNKTSFEMLGPGSLILFNGGIPTPSKDSCRVHWETSFTELVKSGQSQLTKSPVLSITSLSDDEYVIVDQETIEEVSVSVKTKYTYVISKSGKILKGSLTNTSLTYTYDREPEYKYLTVPFVEYTTIATEGLKTFMDSLIYITGVSLTLREQQIYNFSNGDTITFSYQGGFPSESGVSSIYLKSGEYTELNNYEIGYNTTAGSGALPVVSINREGCAWLATCTLNINSSYDVPQIITSDDLYSKRYIQIPNSLEGEKYFSKSVYKWQPMRNLQGPPEWKYRNYIRAFQSFDDADVGTSETVGSITYPPQALKPLAPFTYNSLQSTSIKPNYQKLTFFEDSKGFSEVSNYSFGIADAETWKQYYERTPSSDFSDFYLNNKDYNSNLTSEYYYICLNDYLSDFTKEVYIPGTFFEYSTNKWVEISEAKWQEYITNNNADITKIFRKVKGWQTFYRAQEIESNIYMLTSIMLNKVGGKNIDITYIDSTFSVTKPYVFIYDKSSTFVEPYYTLSTDNLIVANVQSLQYAGFSSIQFELNNVSESAYSIILPIKYESDKCDFTFYLDDKLQNPINSGSITNGVIPEKELGKMYYYLISLEGSTNEQESKKSIKIEWTDAPSYENTHVNIYPMFRGTPNNYFVDNYDITHEDICNQISTLDIDGIFNYIYPVNDNEKIEDPLNSKEFFNPYHVFNSFTIAQGDLLMASNNGSNVSLVNNR